MALVDDEQENAVERGQVAGHRLRRPNTTWALASLPEAGPAAKMSALAPGLVLGVVLLHQLP